MKPKTKQHKQKLTIAATYCREPDPVTADGRCGQVIVEIVVDAYDTARVTHVCERGHRVVVRDATS